MAETTSSRDKKVVAIVIVSSGYWKNPMLG